MWVSSEIMEVRVVTSNQSLPDFPVMREFTGNFAQFGGVWSPEHPENLGFLWFGSEIAVQNNREFPPR